MTRSTTRIFLVGTLGALTLAAGGIARAADNLPPVQRSGAIEYLSGGVGHDQSRAVEAAAAHWPLTLEFAIKEGKRDDFAADVGVKIFNAQGHAVLETTASGPFLLAKLSPGQYKVDATIRGKTLHQAVDVKADHAARSVFVWPAGTDGTRPAPKAS